MEMEDGGEEEVMRIEGGGRLRAGEERIPLSGVKRWSKLLMADGRLVGKIYESPDRFGEVNSRALDPKGLGVEIASF